MTALLKRGVTSTSAGGFFFIPYLLQLGGHGLASSLGPAKREGIPPQRIALGMVFESIFGYSAGIRAVDSVSRADFGLLAGLPFLPSPSTQYRFLQRVPVRQALDFQTALGKRLVSLGQITPGFAVNVDGHNLKTYSRKQMKLSFITKEDRYAKAIRTLLRVVGMKNNARVNLKINEPEGGRHFAESAASKSVDEAMADLKF